MKGISDDLSEMPYDDSFPTPAMTDTWGEGSTLSLLRNSPSELVSPSDGAKLLTEPQAAAAEVVAKRSEVVSDGRTPEAQSIVNMTLSRSKGNAQLGTFTSTGGRLSHVLEALAAAGFDSLDDAVVAYYVESLQDNERLRQEQRLSRIRRLPVLLKQLHLAAQGWGEWQRRSFQEQMIKSTEDIIVAELEDHLAAKRPSCHNSTCSTEHPGQACKHKERDETDIEAQVSMRSILPTV